ncbi:orf118 (mitochondrion) [Phoenix dactylifera]|uniref:Orf118 n=1 Tax=Phoenix dactylifera TaxID=42345 RepID=G9HNW0_PHODC|nr:orf118 [Phoenix dactylifera]AEM43940.1 orf118 [Phoenix dactylifera]
MTPCPTSSRVSPLSFFYVFQSPLMIVYCESVRHICLHSGPSKKQRNEEVTSKPVVAMSPPRKPSVTEPTSSARKDTTPASLPSSTPATTKITAQPPLEGTPAPQLSKMEQIRLRPGR